MLDFFLSSDWAIIATELLAGFFVITIVLAVLVWRGQRRHTGAAESLLDDRDPILRATEEMVERQIKRVWPELTLDEEQRQTYADRSLDAVEAMVEPWLEPKRSDLSSVARQFQRVRQEDLEQLLTLARAQAEASQADDERVEELEQELQELREQRDRQGRHLNDSLETINVMVREYGRKFDYNEEPHVATVLKAIVMLEEMEAGADCETAQQRAENLFTEDLVASPGAPPQEPEPEASEADLDGETAESGDEAPAEADTVAGSDESDGAVSVGGESSTETQAMDVGGEETGRDEMNETPASDAETEPTDTSLEQTGEPAPSPAKEPESTADEEDIDALIAQAQASSETPATADESTTAEAEPTAEDQAEQAKGGEQAAAEPPTNASNPPDEPDEETLSADADQPAAPSPEKTETSEPESRRGEETEDNGVIDLDDVEIPEEDQEKAESGADEFDLDDIDALLDAEIAKKHGKSQE